MPERPLSRPIGESGRLRVSFRRLRATDLPRAGCQVLRRRCRSSRKRCARLRCHPSPTTPGGPRLARPVTEAVQLIWVRHGWSEHPVVVGRGLGDHLQHVPVLDDLPGSTARSASSRSSTPCARRITVSGPPTNNAGAAYPKRSQQSASSTEVDLPPPASRLTVERDQRESRENGHTAPRDGPRGVRGC